MLRSTAWSGSLISLQRGRGAHRQTLARRSSLQHMIDRLQSPLSDHKTDSEQPASQTAPEGQVYSRNLTLPQLITFTSQALSNLSVRSLKRVEKYHTHLPKHSRSYKFCLCGKQSRTQHHTRRFRTPQLQKFIQKHGRVQYLHTHNTHTNCEPKRPPPASKA